MECGVINDECFIQLFCLFSQIVVSNKQSGEFSYIKLPVEGRNIFIQSLLHTSGMVTIQSRHGTSHSPNLICMDDILRTPLNHTCIWE